MTQDLTEEQEASLDNIAILDKWDKEPYTREALGRLVRAKMYDGSPFAKAVILTLADVPREDDTSVLAEKAKRKEQEGLVLLGKMREAVRRRFQKSLSVSGPSPKSL